MSRATIIADASYCNETRVAGYGYWIASDRGKLGGGGRMTTEQVVTSTAAEVMAIANSIHHAIAAGLVQEGDELLVQTDCQGAINAFMRLRPNLAQQEQHAVKYVEGLEERFKLKIRYKHVEGHSSKPGARFVANHMCDKRAKEAMRAARTVYFCKQLKESFK